VEVVELVDTIMDKPQVQVEQVVEEMVQNQELQVRVELIPVVAVEVAVTQE
tara:strand:- start:60 stop:212 length:153 start_codon:yes stop_codon:yes gene_type:complete